LQRAGHRPVALVGGGTGMIGDPSGRTSERQLLSEDEIGANSRAIEKQLSRFLDFRGKKGALMRDNAAWLRPLKAVEFMRDVSKWVEVRQDGGGRGMARPRAHVTVQVLSVLDQRRRSRCGKIPEAIHASLAQGDRGAREADPEHAGEA